MALLVSAGDRFIDPHMFISAVDAAGQVAGFESLETRSLTSAWPMEPFGPVDGVDEASGDVDTLIDALQGAAFAATHLAPFTARVFENAPDLRFLGVCRGGPVNVDLEAATAHGVIVSYAPGRNAQAAAEYAIGLMLAAMRHIPQADHELKRGVWRGDYYAYENNGLEMRGTTVGLVGYGAIGSIVARVLTSFGAIVIAHDPYASADLAAADGVTLVELEELLRRSMVVSLHARLTPETTHMLHRDNLALLPRGAVLVNSARGGLLDYEPLPEMLRSGHLGGLALDVYDVEPPNAGWPLFDAPNVVLSPHLAGATRETAQRAAEIVAAELTLFRQGRTPQFVANPEVLERMSLLT